MGSHRSVGTTKMKPFAAAELEASRGFYKKNIEGHAIAGFLMRLGLSGFRVSLQERPDAMIELSAASACARIGCEVQTLYSDGGERGSRLRRFRGRWLRIMDRVHSVLEGG